MLKNILILAVNSTQFYIMSKFCLIIKEHWGYFENAHITCPFPQPPE